MLILSIPNFGCKVSKKNYKFQIKLQKNAKINVIFSLFRLFFAKTG